MADSPVMNRTGDECEKESEVDVSVTLHILYGLLCRLGLEILESFDIVNQIWKESCHMAEVRFNATMRFWKRIWEYRTDQS